MIERGVSKTYLRANIAIFRAFFMFSLEGSSL
jgi:hypothetical protein